MGYIYSSSGYFYVQLASVVGQRTQNGEAFFLQNHQAPHERQALRQQLVLAQRTVYDVERWVCIKHHFYLSDFVHLVGNSVVLSLSQLYNHPTWLPMPSSGNSTRN
jgi:hypothetical protein